MHSLFRGATVDIILIIMTLPCPPHVYSHGGHTDEEPGDNHPDPPMSAQVTGSVYAEITDQESNDPSYATVGIATGKYTYNITTNTSYDTVMLHNMTPNASYGNAV